MNIQSIRVLTVESIRKKRDVVVRSHNNVTTTNYKDGRPPLISKSKTESICRQETVSQDTLWPLRNDLLANKRVDRHWRKSLRERDFGSNFYTSRQFYKETPKPRSYSLYKDTSLATYVATGELVAHSNSTGPSAFLWPSIPVITDESLIVAGASAIAKVLPTNPASDMSVFIGELFRDGIPSAPGLSLLRDRIHFFRSLGNEYLNVEFGWKPFINEIRKFAYVADNSQRIISQYERDSGRLIRRRFKFPTVFSSTQTAITSGPPQPGLPTTLYKTGKSVGTKTKRHEETLDVWFSGAFTYYLTSGKSIQDKMARHAQLARKLVGVELTPDVLWNLAPWSWAADWVGNFGDVFRNISAFSQDGLVMRWGYIMAHSTVSDTYSNTGCQFHTGEDVGTLTQTFGAETKRRMRATPYGFGLDPDIDFSLRQWAILGALGITRGSPDISK